MIDSRAPVIDREWIASRIPHRGSMCLLDRVESWDRQSIVCRADSHTSPENPLRVGDGSGGLGIANAIEYAAQAMAVHCALLIAETGAPKSGYLTSVRQVQWYRSRLDDLTHDLSIRAQRISGNELNVLYDFDICAGSLLLIDGRASVVLNAAAV